MIRIVLKLRLALVVVGIVQRVTREIMRQRRWLQAMQVVLMIASVVKGERSGRILPDPERARFVVDSAAPMLVLHERGKVIWFYIFFVSNETFVIVMRALLSFALLTSEATQLIESSLSVDSLLNSVQGVEQLEHTVHFNRA